MEINLKQLNSIDLDELSSLIIEEEYKNYFLDKPSKEHYYLLAYFSLQHNNSTLLDIGTYKGCSSLALSYNPTNNVISFDIREGLKRLWSTPENIEYIVDDCSKEQYKDLVLSSPFIMLDTDHDGTFEIYFHKYLQDIGYKGLLMLDDIKLNESMVDYWNSVKEEKYDISHVGHHSGTGLVIFK